MPSAEEVYRESQARLHRTLGTYLALKAWQSKVDCVVLARKTFLSFLGLERMKDARIDWIKEDLAYLFPFAKTTQHSEKKTYATLYLSRVELPDSVWNSMTTQARIAQLQQRGVTAVSIKLPTEKQLLQEMALIINGVDGG